MECAFQLIKGMRQLESQDKDWKENHIPIKASIRIRKKSIFL
jgi:hypothetical protein